MKKSISLFLTIVMACAVTACGTAANSSSVAEGKNTESLLNENDNGAVNEGSASDDAEGNQASEGKVTSEGEIILGDGTGEDDADNGEDGTSPNNGTDTEEEISLKDFFAQHDMKVGTCLSPQMLSNSGASDLILEQFNSVTCENAMKPDSILKKAKSIEAGDIVVEFNSDTKKLLKFAKDNGLALRGHTIIWHEQTPEWIFYEDFDTTKALASREVMISRMESYIKQVFEELEETGYADMFYAYDVVNEAYMENGTMRDSLWKETIGDDYIWQAFYFADKYAPEHIDLYYNDYNEQFKAGRLAKLSEELVDENGKILIDGIGLQAHLYTQDDLDNYLRSISKIAASGLKIEITELDVGLGAYQNVLDASDENLKAQGQFYYKLIEEIVRMKDEGFLNMDALTFWGFADNMSWRRESSPLLYTATLQPKYAYYGAIQKKGKAGF